MVADAAFDALADPVRREILSLLAARHECSAGELAEAVDRVGRTAVSSHLRILRTAGLVSERRYGRYRLYSIDRDGVAKDVLAMLQGLLQSSVDAVRSAAEDDRKGLDVSGDRDDVAM